MSKIEKCTCKACKNTVFHCQICKFVGFLLPSSSWLLKLPNIGLNTRTRALPSNRVRSECRARVYFTRAFTQPKRKTSQSALMSVCFTFRLFSIHGPDWVIIGQAMGRSNSSVCRKYYKAMMEGVCTVHSIYNNLLMVSVGRLLSTRKA